MMSVLSGLAKINGVNFRECPCKLKMTWFESRKSGFFQVLSKVTICGINRRKFLKLLNNANNMVKNGSTGLKRHLQEYGRIGDILYVSYICTVFFVATDFCLVPLSRPERELPIGAWYPFDYKNSTILYTVAYCYQASAIYTFWFCTAVDVMFGILVLGCCAQYKVMQEELRGLNKSDSNQLQQGRRANKCSERSAIEFDKEISMLVNLHCEVCDLVKDINDVYTYILFLLFLTCMTMSCCVGLQISNGYENFTNSELIWVGMVVCLLFELLLYYLPADMLIEEAAAVGMAAYHSDWESMPPKCQYSVLLVILRSAKPPKLENGRISPLILENYATFLGTTASYFTSLRAIAGGD